MDLYIILLVAVFCILALTTDKGEMRGGWIGSIMASLLSWQRYHDLGWAIIHGLCSWFYVLWYGIHYMRW